MRLLAVTIASFLIPQAAQATDYSDLIPEFPHTGDSAYDLYLDRLDYADENAGNLRPTYQLDVGAAGLYDPNNSNVDVGWVKTNWAGDYDHHYQEHWYFIGPFDWDGALDATQLGPADAVLLPADNGSDPYLYMDIWYRHVPAESTTDGLTLVDPILERAAFEVEQLVRGQPVVTAQLMRELHHHPLGDRYVDHWLFTSPELLLIEPGDSMSLVPVAAPAHTAAWFDQHRASSTMYTQIRFMEW